jgi:uncharacterized membrane protein
MSSTQAAKARKLTLGLLGALLAFMAIETFLFAPPSMSLATILFIIAIKIIPPGLFFYPILRWQPMSAVWLGILLLLYFCWAVLGALIPGTEGIVAILRTILTAACFISAMYFARWQRAATGQ